MAYIMTVACDSSGILRKPEAIAASNGVSFEDAEKLFTSGVDYLDVYDDEHSREEDRFIAIGAINRGIVLVAYTERQGDVIRILSARMATKREARLFEEYWRSK